MVRPTGRHSAKQPTVAEILGGIFEPNEIPQEFFSQVIRKLLHFLTSYENYSQTIDAKYALRRSYILNGYKK